MLSMEFKEAEFKLLFYGSDGVVKAYKDLKEYLFSGKFDQSKKALQDVVELQSCLITEIRKSLGYEANNNNKERDYVVVLERCRGSI